MVKISDESYKLLMRNKVTNEDFLKLNNIDEGEFKNIVYNMVNCAIEDNNASMLEMYIFFVFRFKLYDDALGEKLYMTLPERWHTQHENIASILQKLKLPESVEALYITANKKYDYLEYDEFYALAVKCIWGLGDIGTKDAYEKLKILSKSDNEIIAENATKQLGRIEERGLIE